MSIIQTKPDRYAVCSGCGKRDVLQLREYQFFSDISIKRCLTLCDSCIDTLKSMTKDSPLRVEAPTKELRLRPEYLGLWENAVCELRHCVSDEYCKDLCNKLENSMVSFAKGEYDKIKFTIGE